MNTITDSKTQLEAWTKFTDRNGVCEFFEGFKIFSAFNKQVTVDYKHVTSWI